MKTITVSTIVDAPIEHVWKAWTEPEHITQWNFASDDWESPHATNDLRVDGKFTARMQAKDGSAGFDFEGTYTKVEKHKTIEYAMGDGRKVQVHFEPGPDGVQVTETFEMENMYPEEMQRSGWQAILNNFKKHAERSR